MSDSVGRIPFSSPNTYEIVSYPLPCDRVLQRQQLERIYMYHPTGSMGWSLGSAQLGLLLKVSQGCIQGVSQAVCWSGGSTGEESISKLTLDGGIHFLAVCGTEVPDFLLSVSWKPPSAP